MKKILGLSIAAILIIAMVGGGTWAYFNDTETSTGNTLIAGTLDLGLSNADEMATGNTTATWAAEGWAPGATENGTLYISNSGSIAMTTLTASFDYSAVDTSGRPTTITGSPWTTDPTDLFDKMIRTTTVKWQGASVGAAENKTLAELKALGDITLPGGLAIGGKGPLFIEFAFDTAATNGCQGNTVDVTVTVTGTQQ
ncbi:MAG: TasA family protein [Dehalococcoidales bacterium]|nr:TasA family protein [Dehalococcoidales bacterium]